MFFMISMRPKWMRFAAFAAAAWAVACRSQTSHEPTPTKVPQRIISIAPNATEIIACLGQTQRLVGVCTFCVYPPEVKTLPRIGGLFDANPETILKLRPDLVVLRGANQTIEQLCRQSNIRVYRDRTERFDDIYSTLDELGAMLDCRDRAAEVRTQMQRRLDQIAKAVAGRPRPKVLLTLARRPDSLADIMTASKNTFLNEVLARAGGENVFAEMAMDYPRVSFELILAAKPEVIIEAMPETPDSPTLLPTLRDQWRRLGPIPAVAANQIFVLHDENCLIPSPRIVDVIAKIARLLHPEAVLD